MTTPTYRIVNDEHGRRVLRDNEPITLEQVVAAVNTLPRYIALADAVREWRASWEVIDDAAAAVEMRRVARERMFAALNALDEAGQ
jgi:hypothetical protein